MFKPLDSRNTQFAGILIINSEEQYNNICEKFSLRKIEDFENTEEVSSFIYEAAEKIENSEGIIGQGILSIKACGFGGDNSVYCAINQNGNVVVSLDSDEIDDENIDVETEIDALNFAILSYFNEGNFDIEDCEGLIEGKYINKRQILSVLKQDYELIFVSDIEY